MTSFEATQTLLRGNVGGLEGSLAQRILGRVCSWSSSNMRRADGRKLIIPAKDRSMESMDVYCWLQYVCC